MLKPIFNNSSIPLSEYPRPQFRRESYFCLNGEWDYAINKNIEKPLSFQGKINVPYSPEAKLSGVEKQLKPNEYLHYKKIFILPEGFKKDRVILNFGACDQVCKVFINNHIVVEHFGGYNSFFADVTNYICDGENELYICVADDASSDVYGRGKQKYKRGGIWYTATSGIWQTVWIESVTSEYIKQAKINVDFDERVLNIDFTLQGNGVVCVEIIDGDNVLCAKETADGKIQLSIDYCEQWTPENPKLYELKYTFGNDVVYSYFGLRKYSLTEINGKKYFALNNKPYFHNGLLDQGYWKDGFYTPPTNKAMYDEILAVKMAGFNMLRKHIKVEPMLWYYYCDVLGVLVWQDMINGGGEYSMLRIALAPFVNLHINDKNFKKMKRSKASRKQYMIEAKEMINQLYNCVSLCLWTPFNEAWGQFDALNVLNELKKLDDTRLFDHASGWQDMGGGDVNSKHIYFRKARMKNDGRRVLSLTEFGGYSFAMPGHTFCKKKFGYKGFGSVEALTEAYKKLYRNEIIPAIKKDGLCATVYTQLTDVEDEINGLFTFDRIAKIATEDLQKINSEVYSAFADVVKQL